MFALSIRIIVYRGDPIMYDAFNGRGLQNDRKNFTTGFDCADVIYLKHLDILQIAVQLPNVIAQKPSNSEIWTIGEGKYSIAILDKNISLIAC